VKGRLLEKVVQPPSRRGRGRKVFQGRTVWGGKGEVPHLSRISGVFLMGSKRVGGGNGAIRGWETRGVGGG